MTLPPNDKRLGNTWNCGKTRCSKIVEIDRKTRRGERMKRELKAIQYRIRDALDYGGTLIGESDDPIIHLLYTHLMGASDCLDDLDHSILDIPHMKKRRNKKRKVKGD